MSIGKKLVWIAIVIALMLAVVISVIKHEHLIVSVKEARAIIMPSVDFSSDFITYSGNSAGELEGLEAQMRETERTLAIAQKNAAEPLSLSNIGIWLRVEFLMVLALLRDASLIFFLLIPIVATYGGNKIESVQKFTWLVKKSQLIALAVFFFVVFLKYYTPLAPPKTALMGY